MEENIILTVKDVNSYIKRLFEYDSLLNNLQVKGEISNYKRHSSGHLYFSIKDKSGKLTCVMFKGDTFSLNFEPKDGMQVIISGYLSVFEKNGNYQLYVKSMKKKGLGDLYEEYNKLLETLKEQGYFDESHKKEIPKNPKTIAVVTSKTGAAVRDIISVIKRRNKLIKIIICPVKVQGEGSGEEIANTIYKINRLKLADTIIVGRGGGSIEELWAFNERVLAQSVYDSEIPIISAVGHETDFTICDFVSDIRAATPSVAGELAVNVLEDKIYKLNDINRRIHISINNLIDIKSSKLDSIKEKSCFLRPYDNILNLTVHIDKLKGSINNNISNELYTYNDRINNLKKLIKSLSIEDSLKRGFIIISKEDKILTSANEINIDDNIDLLMKDGTISSKVINKESR